ncbi:unnamed protein product [Amoebophrya sp. A25]|nr:unnamed protein product [Amoebophrya sp. A25]|eukprot:GSA25T00016403001.1
MTELVVFGEKEGDGRFFDFFCESNLLADFVRALGPGTRLPSQLRVQLLQTLSILVTNVKETTSLYYLFSNNYLSQLIASFEVQADGDAVGSSDISTSTRDVIDVGEVLDEGDEIGAIAGRANSSSSSSLRPLGGDLQGQEDFPPDEEDFVDHSQQHLQLQGNAPTSEKHLMNSKILLNKLEQDSSASSATRTPSSSHENASTWEEDEEVLSYYISFLKTLTLRLNVETIKLFFYPNMRGNKPTTPSSTSPDDSNKLQQQDEAAFPLYTAAIRFESYLEDPMVVTAVRSITLHIFRLPDPQLQRYLLTDRHSRLYLVRFARRLYHLFAELAHIVALDEILYDQNQDDAEEDSARAEPATSSARMPRAMNDKDPPPSTSSQKIQIDRRLPGLFDRYLSVRDTVLFPPERQTVDTRTRRLLDDIGDALEYINDVFTSTSSKNEPEDQRNQTEKKSESSKTTGSSPSSSSSQLSRAFAASLLQHCFRPLVAEILAGKNRVVPFLGWVLLRLADEFGEGFVDSATTSSETSHSDMMIGFDLLLGPLLESIFRMTHSQRQQVLDFMRTKTAWGRSSAKTSSLKIPPEQDTLVTAALLLLRLRTCGSSSSTKPARREQEHKNEDLQKNAAFSFLKNDCELISVLADTIGSSVASGLIPLRIVEDDSLPKIKRPLFSLPSALRFLLTSSGDFAQQLATTLREKGLPLVQRELLELVLNATTSQEIDDVLLAFYCACRQHQIVREYVFSDTTPQTARSSLRDLLGRGELTKDVLFDRSKINATTTTAAVGKTRSHDEDQQERLFFQQLSSAVLLGLEILHSGRKLSSTSRSTSTAVTATQNNNSKQGFQIGLSFNLAGKDRVVCSQHQLQQQPRNLHAATHSQTITNPAQAQQTPPTPSSTSLQLHAPRATRYFVAHSESFLLVQPDLSRPNYAVVTEAAPLVSLEIVNRQDERSSPSASCIVELEVKDVAASATSSHVHPHGGKGATTSTTPAEATASSSSSSSSPPSRGCSSWSFPLPTTGGTKTATEDTTTPNTTTANGRHTPEQSQQQELHPFLGPRKRILLEFEDKKRADCVVDHIDRFRKKARALAHHELKVWMEKLNF